MNINYKKLQTNAPEIYQRFIELENFTTKYINNQAQNNNNRLINDNDLIIIPVVVHILYSNDVQNISMDRIQSQIDVLNQDFRRLNADAVNTPAAFLPVASDLGIEFRLACIDPNGNPTNGVVRRQTSMQEFHAHIDDNGKPDDETNGIKTSPTGSVSWNTSVADDRYLNIWVCNLMGAGYGTWPAYYSLYPQYDGIVIKTANFGVIPGNTSAYNKGRTATHEIGHWLNLHHLWGDEGEFNLDCLNDDGCDDTPKQNESHLINCPPFPELDKLCNPADVSTMFMNFMDYVKDECMNLFTQDQKDRARALFASGGFREQQLNNWFKVRQSNNPIACTGTIYSSPICLPTTWTVLSGPATLTPGPGPNQATLQATGVGNVLIRATSGNYTTDDNISVTNLPPPQPGAINVLLVDPYIGKIQVECTPVFGATDYRWYKNGVLQSIYHSTFAQIPITKNLCDVSYGIEVAAGNGCGYSSRTYSSVYVPPCNNYRISPNPAQNNVTISVTNSASENATFDEVKVFDLSGNIRRSAKYKSIKTATINIEGLISGTYFIEISSGNYKERQQLIIQ